MTTRFACITLAAAFIGIAPMAGAADTYLIDNIHFSVGFQLKHLGIANLKGRFNEYNGTVAFDGVNIASASVKITLLAASIDSGNTDRDAELRGVDFLYVEKYPEITFRSTKLSKKGKSLEARGPLTVKGVSRPVTIRFRLKGPVQDLRGETRLGMEGGFLINRKDFAIRWNKKLKDGTPVLGRTVRIAIDGELVKQAPAIK